MMTPSLSNVSMMDQFPDFKSSGFDMDKYNSQFINSNYIINAWARQVSYNKHWGCLSLKCAFYGNEFYECNGGLYSVNKSAFLVLNEGTYYSSYIDAKDKVESFTINFAPGFEKTMYQALVAQPGFLLDNHAYTKENEKIHFTEKLLNPTPQLSNVIGQLMDLSKNLALNQEQILETYFILYENLFHHEEQTQIMISEVKAVKHSTKKELFVRLNRAKDFIDSNYKINLTLEELANISCLNQYYFLRQFKIIFGDTPHQYLQRKRIQKAASLLKNTNHSVTQVCNDVGFIDYSSFSKLFKKYYGSSPTEYNGRKRVRRLFF